MDSCIRLFNLEKNYFLSYERCWYLLTMIFMGKIFKNQNREVYANEERLTRIFQNLFIMPYNRVMFIKKSHKCKIGFVL